MKCPERYNIMQHNIRKPIFDEDNIVRGEYHLLVETQQFENCYKKNVLLGIKKNKYVER